MPAKNHSFNSRSKIYIAGHTGLVGSAILRKLASAGYENLLAISSRELDLTNQNDVNYFFKNERPEVVFLCAAKVGGISANIKFPAEFININLAISSNIINSCYKHKVSKLINFGSACMYPPTARQPITEAELLSGPLERTNEAYALAKISAVKMCHYFNKQYNTNFINLVPTNQYGINDNFNMANGHVIPMLIRRFHIAKLLQNKDYNNLRKDFLSPLSPELDKLLAEAGGAMQAPASLLEQIANSVGAFADHVEVWGDGSVRREFMFSEDLADACLYLMENYDASDIGEFINVGVGNDILMRDLIELVRQVLGFDGELIYDRSKPNGMPQKTLDSSRLYALGWQPRTSLREGIRKTYDAYLNKQNTL